MSAAPIIFATSLAMLAFAANSQLLAARAILGGMALVILEKVVKSR